MNTIIKKVYPDTEKLHKQSKLICSVISELSEFGIEILSVEFRSVNPIISVANCNANKKLRSHFVGQGINSNGDYYNRKLSIFCGCNVVWLEPRYE